MTEIQGAIAAAQLGRLRGIVERRRAIAAALDASLEGVPGIALPQLPEGVRSSYWMYHFNVPDRAEEFAQAVRAAGVPLASGYVTPLYLVPALRSRGPTAHRAFPSTPPTPVPNLRSSRASARRPSAPVTACATWPYTSASIRRTPTMRRRRWLRWRGPSRADMDGSRIAALSTEVTARARAGICTSASPRVPSHQALARPRQKVAHRPVGNAHSSRGLSRGEPLRQQQSPPSLPAPSVQRAIPARPGAPQPDPRSEGRYQGSRRGLPPPRRARGHPARAPRAGRVAAASS